MADPKVPVNSGEEATNAASSSLNLDAAAQFRTLSKRLDEVADQVSRVHKSGFGWSDAIQLGAILIALLAAIFTALGLKDRIDDLVKAQTAAETRISAQITATESRITGRMDRLDDRVAGIGDRAATLEGARSRPPK